MYLTEKELKLNSSNRYVPREKNSSRKEADPAQYGVWDTKSDTWLDNITSTNWDYIDKRCDRLNAGVPEV